MEEVAARAAERERMADLLHDDVLPLLALLRQELLEIPEALVVVRFADMAMAAVREVVRSQHPAAVDRDDIEQRLEQIAAPICQRAGLRLHLEVDEPRRLAQRRLPDDSQNVLLGGVRELCENAARHSKASTLRVTAVRDVDGVVVSVTDDGIGVTPALIVAREQDGHLGLRRLRERMSAIGAGLKIDSEPGFTKVSMRIPDGSAPSPTETLLDATQQAWGLVSAENRLTHASPALAVLAGRSREELVDASADARPWLVDPAEVAAARQRTVALGSHAGRLRLLHPQDGPREFLMVMHRLPQLHLDQPLVLALVHDIARDHG